MPDTRAENVQPRQRRADVQNAFSGCSNCKQLFARELKCNWPAARILFELAHSIVLALESNDPTLIYAFLMS